LRAGKTRPPPNPATNNIVSISHWCVTKGSCSIICPRNLPDELIQIRAAELFRCTNAGQFVERLFERGIQQVETEIDFGFGGR